MGSEKMSKSLGNVKLIHDLLKDWEGEVIRLALLKAHYRSELVWTEDLLKESKADLSRCYKDAQNLKEFFEHLTDGFIQKNFSGEFKLREHNLIQNELEQMNSYNDISVLSDYLLAKTHLSSASKIFDSIPTIEFSKVDLSEVTLTNIADVYYFAKLAQKKFNLLGLLQKDPEEWFKGGLDYDALVEEYDSVRAQALAEGVVIESGAGGKSSWRKG